jgi:CDP-diacylglycerol--glycerol-3-phosphate 3-phosphatidyltransferase
VASIYDLKPRFQALLRPLAEAAAAGGVRANAVTWGALLLSVAEGAALALQPGRPLWLLLLPTLLLVRMALNALDGMLARAFNQASPAGAVLNELGDVLADAALYLPLGLVPGLDPLILSFGVVLGVITELAGIAVVPLGAGRRYDGPMGKSDRAFAYGLLALLLGLGVAPGIWSRGLLVLMAVLALLTIWNRCRQGLRAAAGGDTSVSSPASPSGSPASP